MSSLMAASKMKMILALVVTSVVVVSGVVGVQILINNQAQNVLEDSSIELVSLNLQTSVNGDLLINTTIKVVNPSNYNATSNETTVDVRYSGGYLCSIDIPSLNIKPGTNYFTFTSSLNNISQTIFENFFYDFFMDSSVNLEISAKVHISVPTIANLKIDLTLNKTVSLSALNKLSNSYIRSISMINATSNMISFGAQVVIVNPTDVSFSIKNMLMNFSYAGEVLGNITIANKTIVHGNNIISVEGVFQPKNQTAAQELVQTFIAGQSAQISVSFRADSLVSGLTSPITLNFEMNANMNGLSGIDVFLNALKFLSISEDAIETMLNLTIYNPSSVVGDLPDMYFDLLYNGEYLGIAYVPTLPFYQGNNTYTVNATFTDANSTNVKTMIQNMLNGNDVAITLKGSTGKNLLSTLVSGWNKTVNIPSPGKLEFNLSNIKLINSSANAITVQTNISIYNPIDVDLNISNAAFDVFVNSTDYLGNITLTDLQIHNGWNNFTTDLSIVAADTNKLSDLINSYMEGHNITLTIRGHETSGLISDIVSSLSYNITLCGVQPTDIAIISFELYNATHGSVVFNVTIKINNPTQYDVDLNNLTFAVEYEHNKLGNITLPAMHVLRGVHIYSVLINFTIANETAIQILLTDYVHGRHIELLVKGMPNGTDILSKVLANYSTYIVLPPLNLNPRITNFTLVDTTADTIHVKMEIALDNNANMNITLDSANFTIYFKGEVIGNLTISNYTLIVGTNYIQSDVYLVKGNSSTLNDLLSNYIMGLNSTVMIVGNFSTDLEGSINMTSVDVNLTTSLVGIQESLIESVTVDTISINLSYNPITGTITASYTVNAVANIRNPLPFDINITYITYEIYFNDPDGASFYILSYPPKNNIYLTTIEENYTTPVGVAGDSTTSLTASYTSSNVEMAIRLNDEYNSKNQLHIDIRSGTMVVQIGEFEITLNFAFSNVYVSK